MYKSKITIRFDNEVTRAEAADFTLGLVKNGLTFDAQQDCDTLVITMLGGF